MIVGYRATTKLQQIRHTTESIEDVINDADFSGPTAEALRLMAIDKHNSDPSLTDAEIEDKVRDDLREYLNRRYHAEVAIREHERLVSLAEAWMAKNNINIGLGGKPENAYSDNKEAKDLFPEIYNTRLNTLLLRYYSLKDHLNRDGISCPTGNDKCLWDLLQKLYSGTPEDFERAMEDLQKPTNPPVEKCKKDPECGLIPKNCFCCGGTVCETVPGGGCTVPGGSKGICPGAPCSGSCD